MSDDLVVKHNALINASYSLSTVEQRLILLAIVQLREHTHAMQLDYVAFNKPVEISASSYIDVFGVGKSAAYEALKSACKTLFTRQFSYQEPTKKGTANVTTRWVSDIRYTDSTATVAFTFSPVVIPLITYLKDQFTQYELGQVAGLSSSYAVRLYELLIAWRNTGKTPVIEIKEFRGKLGVDEGKYQRMGQFKEKVLDKAVNQINKNTKMNIRYEQHKKGREITGFSFKFKVTKSSATHLGTEEEQIELPVNKKPRKSLEKQAPESMSDEQKRAEKSGFDALTALAKTNGIELPTKKIQ